jgi:Mn-dependent DtxR family transcriptional regulator
MERCDGAHTIADIACELEISFQAAWEVVRLLEEKGLVELSRRPSPTDPHLQ